MAGDGGDDRDLRAGDRAAQFEEIVQESFQCSVIELHQRRHVQAAGIHARPPGQHDAARALRGRRVDRAAQRGNELRVERVDRRPRQAQFDDGVVADGVEHGNSEG